MIYKFRGWLTSLYDHKVQRLMEEEQREMDITRGQWIIEFPPIPVVKIAEHCNRTIKRTTQSLLRLERAGKAYQVTHEGGWLPGKRPPAPTFKPSSSDEPDRWKK